MERKARKFIKYCRSNNLAKVNQYLSLGVDVNTVNNSDDDQDADGSQSALMIACTKMALCHRVQTDRGGGA